jgi:hypothetical protein
MTSPTAEPVSSSFTFLGVMFRLSARRSDHAAIAIGQARMSKSIEIATQEPRARQKRGPILFLDAMTFVQAMIPHREVVAKPEGNLLLELMKEQATGAVSQGVTLDLVNLPVLHSLRSTVRSFNAPGRIPTLNRDAYGDHWRETAEGGALFRTLTLDVPPEDSDPANLDWLRLTMLAVLAHLRLDVDVWVETGFLRIRCCENCGAWFKSHRMAGRPRFCSTYCRVAFSRKASPR